MSDVEKDPETTYKAGSHDESFDIKPAEGSSTFSWYYKIMNTLGAEERGIERVMEEDKHDTDILNTGSMWLGGNLVIATFDLGVLGPAVFYLSFWECFLVIIFFTLLGALPVALFSTFGIKTGMRQMVISRYFAGYNTVRLFGFINAVACCGWSIVNTVASAQILHVLGPEAPNDGGVGSGSGHMPAWAAILIISLLSMVVSFLGYDVVHLFEKYTWIPVVIMFLVIAIRFGMSHAFIYGELGSGRETAGDVLSFGATVYGFATGWASYASDYTVYMPTNTNRTKVFFCVLGGLCAPILTILILGAAVGMAVLNEDQPRFGDAYENFSVGGLIFEVLVTKSVHGFGQFCMVILALSTVANNIPNMYSLGLSAQVMWSGFRYIPRPIWTIIGTAITIGVSIPAFDYFAPFMTNFMSIISYWLAIYTSIAVSEHFIWRRGFAGYDLEAYNKPRELPLGLSALFGFCAGVAGVVVGMAQTWYVGKLAGMITLPFGGDIGFELGFGFAFVGYNSTRYFEKKYWGY